MSMRYLSTEQNTAANNSNNINKQINVNKFIFVNKKDK